MTKQQTLTETQWYVGVTGKKGAIPDDATVMRLLETAGCQEIEALGHGTAQARVPAEWADAVEREGHFSTEAAGWRVDLDLP